MLPLLGPPKACGIKIDNQAQAEINRAKKNQNPREEPGALAALAGICAGAGAILVPTTTVRARRALSTGISYWHAAADGEGHLS